jgi:hypothetical protein
VGQFAAQVVLLHFRDCLGGGETCEDHLHGVEVVDQVFVRELLVVAQDLLDFTVLPHGPLYLLEDAEGEAFPFATILLFLAEGLDAP